MHIKQFTQKAFPDVHGLQIKVQTKCTLEIKVCKARWLEIYLALQIASKRRYWVRDFLNLTDVDADGWTDIRKYKHVSWNSDILVAIQQQLLTIALYTMLQWKKQAKSIKSFINLRQCAACWWPACLPCQPFCPPHCPPVFNEDDELAW